ncbi:membrane protein [Clostridium novyi B str. ATCC 27606]|uniref:Membrane protein n=1 Tax=Clostridium novyi B str. ATCC 27606 TaxID=1443123 RepID=A0AA40ITG3_CLONO|nr:MULTISPECIES: ECF transporter S component [Clostridium]KEI14251.1 membrane protein [Clostridium novyi B str. NCTC 9691]KEI14687.1 membrane protein [Clostridium novyi B str. ATCC 27606]OOB76155.1 BioY family transporter [Clostridium haemolyticum]
MEHNKKKQVLTSSGLKLIDLIQIGLMASIIFILTSVVHIPSFMGVIHLGDSMIFLGAILLEKKKGAISAAIGMSLFDILNGYILWAPFTFFIKGIMGYIAGVICYRKNYNGENLLNNLFGFIVSGLFMIIAYYLSGVIMARFLIMKVATMDQAFVIALKDIPGNISQVVGGVIIALPLSLILKKTLKK